MLNYFFLLLFYNICLILKFFRDIKQRFRNYYLIKLLKILITKIIYRIKAILTLLKLLIQIDMIKKTKEEPEINLVVILEEIQGKVKEWL